MTRLDSARHCPTEMSWNQFPFRRSRCRSRNFRRPSIRYFHFELRKAPPPRADLGDARTHSRGGDRHSGVGVAARAKTPESVIGAPRKEGSALNRESGPAPIKPASTVVDASGRSLSHARSQTFDGSRAESSGGRAVAEGRRSRYSPNTTIGPRQRRTCVGPCCSTSTSHLRFR